MVSLSLKGKWMLFKALVSLWLDYGYPLLQKSIEIREKVILWSDDWKTQGIQVDREEESSRFVRLGKAHGLLAGEVQLRRMEQALNPIEDHIRRQVKRRGKAR